MNNILLLTDYKNHFGVKEVSHNYRGGMDLEKLINYFHERNFKATTTQFTKLNISKILADQPIILYTSSEDKNNNYKSFIEDIIFSLEEQGLTIIPRFAYLRAHNNKVAMELLRARSKNKILNSLPAKVFGTYEEIHQEVNSLTYPIVIKPASGSCSNGVKLANNQKELLDISKQIAKSKNIKHDAKEILRSIKYGKSYIKESFCRKPYIAQTYIPNLNNDWKVLVYGDSCYVLLRKVRDNDFRASGSGKFIFVDKVPHGMLDFALAVRKHFNVPHISLDIAFDGKIFYILEFQFLYFGTLTLEKSEFYFQQQNTEWLRIYEKPDLERVYVDSIISFLKNLSS